MNRRLAKLVNSLAPPRGAPSSQLDLFPSIELYVLPALPSSPIRLPRSILQIRPDERLSDYLSRVADAAMTAATKAHGTPRQAAIRLGTSNREGPDPDDQADSLEPEPSKPRLVLAINNH
jgi:hypothetical protein